MSVRSKLVNWSIDVREQRMVDGRRKVTWHLTGVEYMDLFMVNGKYVYTAPIKNVVVEHSMGTVDIFTENMHYHNLLAEMSREENHGRSCVLFINEPLHRDGLMIYFDLDNMNLFDRMYYKERDIITYGFFCLKSKMQDKITINCANNYVTLCVPEQDDVNFEMIANTTASHFCAVNVGKRDLKFVCGGKEYELKHGESAEVVR